MAEGLAAAGAKVILVGRNPEKAAARIAKIEAAGGKAFFRNLRSDDKAQVAALLDRVLATHDMSTSSSTRGMNSPTPIFDLTGEEFDRIMSVNVKGVLYGCQIFGKYFLDTKRPGSIINIGSSPPSVRSPRVHLLGVQGRVQPLAELAREWAPNGVRVIHPRPRVFPAEQNRKFWTQRVGNIMRGTPMKRFGEAPGIIGATLLMPPTPARSSPAPRSSSTRLRCTAFLITKAEGDRR